MNMKILLTFVVLLAIGSVFGVVMLSQQDVVPTTGNVVAEDSFRAQDADETEVIDDISKKVAEPVQEEAEEDESVPEQVIFAGEATTPEIKEEKGSAYFLDVTHVVDEDHVITDGYVMDSAKLKGIEDVLVILRCSDFSIDAEFTDKFGHFTVSGTCREQVAYAEAKYMGETIRTEPVQMPKINKNKGGSRRVIEIRKKTDSNNVPEFSTLTLGVAVVAGTLGMLMIRRQ